MISMILHHVIDTENRYFTFFPYFHILHILHILHFNVDKLHFNCLVAMCDKWPLTRTVQKRAIKSRALQGTRIFPNEFAGRLSLTTILKCGTDKLEVPDVVTCIIRRLKWRNSFYPWHTHTQGGLQSSSSRGHLRQQRDTNAQNALAFFQLWLNINN